MATANEPYGLTPLTTQSLATLGHPLSLRDFNIDAQGRPWRVIRGEKTYYAPQWFDAAGNFTGYQSQAGDPTGQGQGFFHTGMTWDWTKGEWVNPTNWANVIGLSAAGAVAGGAASAFIGPGAGAGGASGGASTSAATTGGLVWDPVAAEWVATGAPAVAPAVTGGGAAATSWLTSPTAALIGAGVNAAGNIWAANKQAATTAAGLAEQQREFDAALAVAKEEQTYNRNQYGDYLGRLSPYLQAGNEANAREAQYMGLPTASGGTSVPSTVTAPTVAPASGSSATNTGIVQPQTYPQGLAPTEQTVLLRAPDGTQQAVPASQAQHYIDRGATRV